MMRLGQAAGCAPSRARRLRCYTLALAVLVSALWSCGTFKPRDPAPPVGDQEPIIILTSIDSVYASIKIGMESKYLNTYMNAFGEEFRFHPDPDDSSALINEGVGDVFSEPWTKQVEEQATGSIFGTVAQLGLGFGAATDSTVYGQDIIELRKPYELQADDNVYRGFADLTIVRSSGEWRIFNWQDLRASGERSWTVLRGRNR